MTDYALLVRQVTFCILGIIALFVFMVRVWNIRKGLWHSKPGKITMTIVNIITSILLLVCFIVCLVLASTLDLLIKRDP